MLKISYASCHGLSVTISARFTFETCVTVWNRQKSQQTSVLAFRVIQGCWFWCQWKAIVWLPISD